MCCGCRACPCTHGGQKIWHTTQPIRMCAPFTSSLQQPHRTAIGSTGNNGVLGDAVQEGRTSTDRLAIPFHTNATDTQTKCGQDSSMGHGKLTFSCLTSSLMLCCRCNFCWSRCNCLFCICNAQPVVQRTGYMLARRCCEHLPACGLQGIASGMLLQWA